MSDEMVSAEKARAVIELHEAAIAGTKDITVAVTTLAAQAPALARTVIALHAILKGRTTPPTDAELAAHGGAWFRVAGTEADRGE